MMIYCTPPFTTVMKTLFSLQKLPSPSKPTAAKKINSLSVSADTSVDLTQYVPIKEGYTFAGWYSDSKLTTAVTSLKLTADATVYAKWLPAQYTLTFETNGGGKITPFPLPPTPRWT